MQKSAITKQLNNIHKQGYVNKQSRFLKSWRQRWLVLTNHLLMTYKERREYKSPTEVIILKEIVSVKTTEDTDAPNAFKVETNEASFYFNCEQAIEKEQWIGTIGKVMIKNNQKHSE